MHTNPLNTLPRPVRRAIKHDSPTDFERQLVVPAFIERLRRIDKLDCYLNVELNQYSRWRIGGRADCVACPRSTRALQQILATARDADVPVVVVGLSTNLLFAEQGIRALVVHLGSQFSACGVGDNFFWAQAGLWVPAFAQRVARAGFTGIEHLAGIPGTLGGLICMNGGSQRKNIGEHVVSVSTLDFDGSEHHYTREQCQFAYRRSVFQRSQHIITDATFSYPRADDTHAVRRQIKTILEQRRRKFPQKLPNCGSVFVSDPDLYGNFGPPGAVIERCGLKGLQRGGAQISSLHANFIVNVGGATTDDVLFLIDHIRTTVWQQTGHDLVAEVKYVDPLGHISPAHVAARHRMQENFS